MKKASTATLTTVLFKRGLRNVFIQGIFLLNRDAPRMVGEAYTLRYIPAREDIDQLGAFEGRGHPQREAIEACPAGGVLVMDARRDASAATGGDILMTRLQVRGVAGVVTDGGLRDSPTIEKLPWPAYCGARSAPLNLVRHHAVESQVPIGCGGVAVYPGDVVVGDARGRGRHPGEDGRGGGEGSRGADRVRGLGRGAGEGRALDFRACIRRTPRPRRSSRLSQEEKGIGVRTLIRRAARATRKGS